ncbi:MAG: ATP-binding protein [Candidatus Anammoxibacter sp.]
MDNTNSQEVIELLKQNQEIVELLKQNVIFRNIDTFDEPDVVKEIFAIIKISYLEPGQTIMEMGDPGDSIVLILDGIVDVIVKKEVKGGESESSYETVKANEVHSGSFVGEMALISQSTRIASVRTQTKCCIGTIQSVDFWHYFRKNPGLAKNIIIEMNRRAKDVSANYINRLIAEKEEQKRAKEELEIMVKEKTEQLREKDVQLLTMDRISGITKLAAGIAHEINNPLSFVKGSVTFVKKGVSKMVGAAQYWDDKPLSKDIADDYKDYLSQINFDYMIKTLDDKFDRIRKGIDRIVVIVKNLKSFSRVDKGDMCNIDLNQSIKEAVEVLDTEDRENVEFVTELEDGMPLFECSANEIHQSILYALQNAIDAVEDNGIVRVVSSYNEDEKNIIIKIIDNGKGMSPDVLREAMHPFFTTKPVGSGTGLGLTIIERIIIGHGGKLTLSSKENSGTTVTMALPIDKKKDDGDITGTSNE